MEDDVSYQNIHMDSHNHLDMLNLGSLLLHSSIKKWNYNNNVPNRLNKQLYLCINYISYSRL